MAALQHRLLPSSIASLYFQQQNSSKKHMPSPISPTYSSFSVHSPFSSASTASFQNENSPTDSQFENLPSPIDTLNNPVAVYPSGPVSLRMLSPQDGDIALAATYGSDFDYGMMELPDLKKTQQLTLLRSHDGSFIKAMDTVFVQPPLPPSQRHNQPSTQAQPHHIHAQQSLAPPITNNVMFDVDLDEWNASPTTLTVDTHCQPITSYPSMAMDAAQSTSRPKQGDILFEGVLARYSTPPNTGHHQFFDLTSPISSPPSADPIGAHTQSCPTSSRQYQSSATNFYAASPSHISRPPYSQHHQHQHHHHHHHHQQHQHQHYSTVHPAEISPLDACPSNSPLSVYHSEMAGCDPGGYLCASDLASPSEGCLKGTLVADIGSSSMGGGMAVTPSAVQDNWNGGDSRKAVQGGNGDFGDLDAEGEDVDLSDDVEQPLNGGGGPLSGSSDPLATVVKSDVGAVGENNELLFDDTDDSKLSEDSCSTSSTDSDGSEFIPGSRPARLQQRRPQTTMSLSYPTYGYSGGTRSSHRTRSGTRYTPYPNGYSTENNGGSYVDGQQQDRSTRRYNNATTTDHHLGGDDGLSAADFSDPYLNITTLSTSSASADAAAAASRRRPRPTNSLPVPIPIPHLTKKSRGRRVPTVTSLEDLRSASSGAGRKRQTVGRGARMYLCEVDGCGKCFARGEHLKRHVRSIHTYEKPHQCPYPGCGKDFSRHDNLGQHMRVHKDYAPSAEA